MTIDEIDSLFETDSNDCFIRLTIPEDKLGDALNLIGRKRMELNIDEIVRVKKYAAKLYEEVSET